LHWSASHWLLMKSSCSLRLTQSEPDRNSVIRSPNDGSRLPCRQHIRDIGWPRRPGSYALQTSSGHIYRFLSHGHRTVAVSDRLRILYTLSAACRAMIRPMRHSRVFETARLTADNRPACDGASWKLTLFSIALC
ncbi:MAG: hypothetical protein KAR13_00070, partial [Desulfobulbaceae bacterium]|nr:hypothetical protein [Desulfobulbaceae bacterium]